MKTFQNLTRGDIILSLKFEDNDIKSSLKYSKYTVNSIQKCVDSFSFRCTLEPRALNPTEYIISIPSGFLKRTNCNNTFYVLDDIVEGDTVCNSWSGVGKGSILYSTYLNLDAKTLEEFEEHRVLGISKSKTGKRLVVFAENIDTNSEEVFRIPPENNSKCQFYKDNEDNNKFYVIGLSKEAILTVIRGRLDGLINDQLKSIENLEKSTIKLMSLRDTL